MTTTPSPATSTPVTPPAPTPISDATRSNQGPPYRSHWWALLILGAVLVAEIAAAVYVLVAIWPAVSQVSATTPTTGHQIASSASIPSVALFGFTWHSPSSDALYLLDVIVLGTIGASIAALTSFGSFVGNRTFIGSWKWWYILRMPIGSALAIIFYFALRGGLLSVSTTTGAISPYGIGAIAALAGMFSKQATDKLNELFTELFRTKTNADDQRSDNLDGTQPTPKGTESTPS